MVTILSRPYDGLTPKQNTVYNGLPFVVSSDKKTVANHKYIAEVFVDGNKITELRHDGDISGNNNGVFDIGRVVENYISYDMKPYGGTLQTYPGYNSNRYYSVKFGEEFTRKQNIKKVYSTGGGQTYIQFDGVTNLRVGDRVLISGSNVAVYNGYKAVLGVYSDTIKIGTTFTTAPTNYSDMSLFEGERIEVFSSSQINGITYLALYVNLNATGTTGDINYCRYNVGDVVILSQDTVAYQYYENSEWNILQKTTGIYNGKLCAKIILDAPHQGNSLIGGGSLISKDNYVLKDQINTTADFSYAFNGVLQYNDDLVWNPMKYNFSTQSNYGKFLTNKPIRSVNVDYTDYWTLSTFGKQLNKTGTFISRIETWSSPTQSSISGTVSQVNNITSAGSHTMMISVGNATLYSTGDYVNVFISPTTYSGRVVKKISNDIYLDIPYVGSSVSGSIVQTIKVRYRMDAGLQDTYSIIPCGPKNFLDTLGTPNEFTDGTCYKYFVWIGRLQTGNDLLYSDPYGNYDIWSEKFEFIIKTECSKFRNYKMTWLNEAGGFDYHKFNMRSDRGLNVERNEFTRKLKSQNSTNKYTYSTGERGRTAYNVKSTELVTIRTNWLSQAELDNISYIYESPEVYILNETNKTLQPVIIKNTDIIVNDKVNMGEAGGLYIYEVQFEMATNRVIQAGGTIKNTATYNYSSGGVYNPYTGSWRDTWAVEIQGWGNDNVYNQWNRQYLDYRNY